MPNVTIKSKVLVSLSIVSFFAISLFTLANHYPSSNFKKVLSPSISRIFSDVAASKSHGGY